MFTKIRKKTFFALELHFFEENTLRFLLGELEGQFDPATDAVPFDELEPFDKLTLAHMCEVHDVVTKAYSEYRFNVVYRNLYDYVTELSNGDRKSVV